MTHAHPLSYAQRLVNPCTHCGAIHARKVDEWQVVRPGGLAAWWVTMKCEKCGAVWRVERLTGLREARDEQD